MSEEPTTTAKDEDKPLPALPLSGRAGSYFRNVRYGLAAMVLIFGLLFAKDGYYGWPKKNVKYDEMNAEKVALEAQPQSDARDEKLAGISKRMKDHGRRYSDTEIKFQKVLGWALPPIAMLMLFRWLRMSRGEYRLDADKVLHAPGHPPVPLKSVISVDKSLWDKKGIAYVNYELEGGANGKILLDDFVYDKKAIRGIYSFVNQAVGSRSK
jgi:hypothetical protein